jgi:hypothetical protein
MDRLIRLFHGGSVKENGEFENMSEDLELFDGPPCSKIFLVVSHQNLLAVGMKLN